MSLRCLNSLVVLEGSLLSSPLTPESLCCKFLTPQAFVSQLFCSFSLSPDFWLPHTTLDFVCVLFLSVLLGLPDISFYAEQGIKPAYYYLTYLPCLSSSWVLISSLIWFSLNLSFSCLLISPAFGFFNLSSISLSSSSSHSLRVFFYSCDDDHHLSSCSSILHAWFICMISLSVPSLSFFPTITFGDSPSLPVLHSPFLHIIYRWCRLFQYSLSSHMFMWEQTLGWFASLFFSFCWDTKNVLRQTYTFLNSATFDSLMLMYLSLPWGRHTKTWEKHIFKNRRLTRLRYRISIEEDTSELRIGRNNSHVKER